MATGPKTERRQPPPVVPVVDVTAVKATDYQVRAHTRGTVSPRTESTLIPEVSGRVIEIAPNFRQGGFFEAGDVLLKIDPRDYENAVTVARSELARARIDVEEEQARSEQAVRDWKRLGEAGEPSDLVLRIPQLASAKAGVAAAQARLEQAATDLERTRIVAPYAGRVLEKNVDVGQYVSPGSVLASVYAVDYVEIRLPLTNEQLEYVRLPERYRGEQEVQGENPEVIVTARIGQREFSWKGRILRTEGAIDTRSRQLFAVAQVDDPYARYEDRPPLKVGQFVEAEIVGETLFDVFVIPRAALRASDQVLIVDDEDRLQRRQVEVLWSEGEQVVIGAGLHDGDRISSTNLPYAIGGTPVRIRGEEREPAERQARAAQSRAAAAGNKP
jgi:RND family efflux transporter MFP subunit